VTATFEGQSDSSVITVEAEDVAPGPEGLERISAEPGRVEVAIAASQHRFGDGEASAVVLARADEYPDALAGTTLAAEHDAPLLLTSSDQLLDNVADEIARVLGDDGQVFLAGGTAALDETVEDAAGDLGYELARLGGQTRFETAGLIAEELGERSQVLVTTGLDFPDALTAGAAASANDGVVLLSAGEDAHDVVDDYLDGFDGEVTAVGGPATRAYPDAEAVMGATRDETAVAVAEAFFDEPVAFGVARRDDYPDALSGGAHIAAYEGPLLLTYTEDVPAETAQWLTNTDAAGGFVYGGTAAVSEDTFDELEDLAFGDNDNDDEGQ
ncbi:MAG TPA: cell wall-binding repeat-containing protein, partial [Beutenbergiaceae bacterium]|nr:cell wall-binding repeat-containing protein [Beutenbergiaceae bacterium]